MAWIEVHQSLLTHRKTLRLCRLLKMDTFAICGRLQALWCWALDNAPDGAIVWADLDSLPGVMGWKGSRDKLIDALLEAGFLDRPDGGGSLRIHDWDDYAGKLIEHRKANAKRQRTWRESKKSGTDDDSNALRNANITVTSPSRNGATVPNPTQPNRTVPTKVSVSGERLLKEVRKEGPSVRPSKEKTPEEDAELRQQKARFTTAQLEDEMAKCRNWVATKPDSRRFNTITKTSWLRRIKDEEIIPAAETDVQRLTRLLRLQPDEKGRIHGTSFTILKQELENAKREEKQQRAYEYSREFARLQAQNTETVLVQEEHNAGESRNGKPRDMP